MVALKRSDGKSIGFAANPMRVYRIVLALDKPSS